MKAEYLDQTCATEDASLAVYRQIVIPNLLLRCREFGGMPPQLSTSFRWKSNYTLMTKATEESYKGEDSIIGPRNL